MCRFKRITHEFFQISDQPITVTLQYNGAKSRESEYFFFRSL